MDSVDFKVGFARTDITPPLGVPMAGYTFLREASAVRDPLELNVLAVSDGTRTAVLLAADLLDLQDNRLAFEMRRRIAAAAGVPVEAVYFHCTHTHLSPAFGKADPHGETSFDGDAAYCESLITKACAAAKAAIADLVPAAIAVGRAEAKRISFIRRFRMKDGSIRTNPGVNNPDILEPIGQVDETVQVIRFKREGRDEVVAVNFGTHPDTVGGEAISADWPGFARRSLEKALDGVKCIFFNGALGDVNHVCVDPKPGEREGLKRDFDDVDRGYDHALHMGRVIAGAVLSVYGKCAPVEAGAVAFSVNDVSIPSNRPKPGDLPMARKYSELHDAGKDDQIPFKGMELTTVVAEAGRMLRLENGPDAFAMPLSVVAIGKAVRFVGIPGEPFTEIGRRIKAESPVALTVVSSITNGYYGYFPTANAYDEGGYEARASIFGSTVADKLVEGIRAMKILCYVTLLAIGVAGCGSPMRVQDVESKRQELLDKIGPYIYNTDGCEMFYYPSNQPITAAAFKALRHDYAKNTAIRTVSYCPLSSGFGYFVVPGVGEYNTGSYPSRSDIHKVYPKGAQDIGHYNAAQAFEQKLGTDAIKMSIDWCRENDCLSFISLRFNDTHDQNAIYGYAFFPPFKAQHPECLMGTASQRPKVCSWTAVDFGQPLVREKMRTFVRQFFEKYDMDGFEIDFFRHAQVFKSVADGGTASEAELKVMTELMAYVRHQADLAGQRRGKPILIAIRTPDSVGYCRAIGLDLETWFERRLVDVWTSTGYFQHEQWPTTVAFARRYGVRCYASMDESRIPRYANAHHYPLIPGRESEPNYYARFAAAFAAGCDGLNLFNLEYKRLSELTRNDPRELVGKDKLYFATERGSGGYRPNNWLVDGDRFNNMPKVDPAYAVKLLPNKPYTFDLMLGEDFPAAEKLGLKPTVTVLALVDDKATAGVSLGNRSLSVLGEEKGILTFNVAPAQIRRGLNSFSIVSRAENVLHDFAVRVTYAP